MKTSRRKFAKMLSASVAAPVVAPAVGLSLWERAETEVAQTGDISAELTHILLDAQGPHGIYDDPKQFESLRAAVARAIPEHKANRDFDAGLDLDVEPLLFFKR
jgi:hypothetical protein